MGGRDAHTPLQMEEIRKADAIVKERESKERIPEDLKKSHLCDIRVERYTTTDLRGMFLVKQTIYRDGKRIETKHVIDGVYFAEMIDAIERALHWRIYEMR